MNASFTKIGSGIQKLLVMAGEYTDMQAKWRSHKLTSGKKTKNGIVAVTQ
jgi:hypothetical protein